MSGRKRIKKPKSHSSIISMKFGACVFVGMLIFVLSMFTINIFLTKQSLTSSENNPQKEVLDLQLVNKVSSNNKKLNALRKEAAALKEVLKKGIEAADENLDVLAKQLDQLAHLKEPPDKMLVDAKEQQLQNGKINAKENPQPVPRREAADVEKNDQEFPVKQMLAQADSEHVHDTSSGAACLGSDTTLLIICHDRADYLRRTLDAVLRYHPGENKVPVVISQDGNSAAVIETVNVFSKKFNEKFPSVVFSHIHHNQDQNLRGENGYVKLSQHYKWALGHVFSSQKPPANRVIILEEDLEIAPDFFEYFGALHQMLDKDSTLLAVSAWNDNGQKNHVQDAEALFRSDFFPGLGWMLTRAVWEELGPKWPKGYWDDWMREPKQRQGRQFIRPEICRTYHFGVQGTSGNEFGQHLAEIKLNKDPVAFGKLDLSYLSNPKWDQQYLQKVKSAPQVTVQSMKSGSIAQGNGPVKIIYNGIKDFEIKANQLGIMSDEKAGVPRTAYKYIVEFWFNGIKVFLTPPTENL